MMTENPAGCSVPGKIGGSTMNSGPKNLQVWWLLAAAVAASAWSLEAIRMPSLSRGLLFDEIEAIPSNRVGLLLGCVPRLPDGRTNRYFTARIEAAARLLHAGKVRFLLVSGDADRDGQDEPAAMRAGLLGLGVPDAAIALDPQGLRTFDSVARAKLVYGLGQFTLISQRFHNERAVYIARALGLSVVGYNAGDPPRIPHDRMRYREPFARMLAVLDARVLRTKPRHHGERVSIGQAP
jgi:SanA protein